MLLLLADIAFALPVLLLGLVPFDFVTVLFWLVGAAVAARAGWRLVVRAPGARREALRLVAFAGAVAWQYTSVHLAGAFVEETAHEMQARCDAAGACPETPEGWTASAGRRAWRTAGLFPGYTVYYTADQDLQGFQVGVRFNIDAGRGFSGRVGAGAEEYFPDDTGRRR